MSPELHQIAQQYAEELAAGIAQADKACSDAVASFTAGRFEEYWTAREKETLDRIKADGDAAIAGGKDS